MKKKAESLKELAEKLKKDVKIKKLFESIRRTKEKDQYAVEVAVIKQLKKICWQQV